MKYAKNLLELLVFSFAIAIANLAHAEKNDTLSFLTFSDIHLNVNQTLPMEINPRGPVIDPLKMNLDPTTFVSMLDNIKKTFPHPQFLLITGDMAGYDPAYVYQDEEYVLQHIDSIYRETPKILVFGNEDSLAKPYGPFFYSTGINDRHSTYELAMKMKNGWKNGFLSTGIYCKTNPGTYPCIIDEDPINGNFSLYLADNLRLIAFNSIVFSSYPSNKATQAVTNAELTWIADELQNAAWHNNNILIATHIPCGSDTSNLDSGSAFWRNNNQVTFYNLLARYQKNIIGILAGHTHYDELKVLQNTAKRNVGAILITPGFVTLHGNAPGLRNYYLNRNYFNWAISDYATYNFDATLALNRLYDFHNYYCTATADKNQSILDCLHNVTADKMSTYFTVGNPNYPGFGKIAYPNNIFITLPGANPSPSVTSNGGGSSNVVYYVAGSAAAAGLGAILFESINSN